MIDDDDDDDNDDDDESSRRWDRQKKIEEDGRWKNMTQPLSRPCLTKPNQPINQPNVPSLKKNTVFLCLAFFPLPSPPLPFSPSPSLSSSFSRYTL